MKKLLITATIAILASTALAPAADPNCSQKPNHPPIRLANYTDGTTIRHPVPLIRGTLADTEATYVKIINKSSKRTARKMRGLARNGNFKVLTQLLPGPNKLIIRARKAKLALTLNYNPQTNPHIVRVFFLTDKTGNTEYQTPVKNDPQNYRGKLATAMLLMQTFTAERMYDLGFGRITFNLELGQTGQPIVRTLQAEESADHYHKMDGLKLWNYAARLIRQKHPNSNAKNLVVPAFTRFDPNTNKTYAHTALGGGALALFGGANIFTWPDSIAQAQKAFMDTTIIDTKSFFSDSVGRHTFWATASTTIGAALHELGHTFGLKHTRPPHDIMTRGFDRFNRAFTLVEPPHAHRKQQYEFDETQTARWDPPSAVWLKFNRWFALDQKHYSDQIKTTLAAHPNRGTIEVTSDHGIAAILFDTKRGTEAHVPIDYNQPPPRCLSIPVADFAKQLNADNALIRIIDTQGLVKKVPVKDLNLKANRQPPEQPPAPAMAK